jgi:putative phosphoserine phosphatase/1-acylglycerol-3-phosphate O-acyltransferase
LIAGYSARVFAGDRIRRREVTLAELARTLTLGVRVRAGRADFMDVLTLSARTWRGRPEHELDELGERLFTTAIEDLVFPEARQLVEAHRRKGHTIVVTSSATRFQVRPVARALGIEATICSQLEVEDGRLTGRALDPSMWGAGKAQAVQIFATDHAIDLRKSYFYADGNEDVALMYLVGKPRPTNPAKQLERVARRRGWPILRFTSRGRPSRSVIARNLAGTASVVPIFLVSAAIGLINRDSRQAVNLTMSRWPDVLFALAGVKVDVAGEEHLWSHRPAVFIFNHRNNFDPFVVAKLVRRDYTGVAKKELANDPIMGILGRLAGMAFVDRANPRRAVAAMGPMVERAKQGVSIITAPEGTRTVGPLGAFKKGPFRMAMAAHIPIVPVVVRNAEAVAPRNGMMMRPGTIEVAVLPPISVEDWTRRNLNERIAEVRQLFVDTLADWPDP